jgi:hypothetical protein
MKLFCYIGLHKWDRCQCTVCNKKRDKEHNWSEDCERCAKCDATRSDIHEWDGCFCLKCKAERHEWNKGNCKTCGCRQEVSVFFDPGHIATDGRSLGLQVKGATYYYKAQEARSALAQLARQVNKEGHALSEHIYLPTVGGNIEITDLDAVEILGTLGSLSQNSMIFDLMAGP